MLVGARIDAIQAMLVLTPMLRIDADEATLAPIDELLTTADELIAATGARNLTPFVLLERAAVCASRGDVEPRVAHLCGAHAGFVLMSAGKLPAYRGTRYRRADHSGLPVPERCR
jgi:hypothetical protein